MFDADAMAAVQVAFPDFVSAIEGGLRAFAAGRMATVPKAALHPGWGGLFHAMPAADEDLAVLKWVAIGREAGGAIEAVMIATDARSGRLLAILDANRITDLRTAAVSVLAIRRLVAPRDGTALGILGCGRQARAHAEMIAACAPRISTLNLCGIRPGAAEALAEAVGPGFRQVSICRSAEEMARTSDIVLSATAYAPASRGLLDPDWLRADALVLAIDLKAAWRFGKADRFSLKVTDDASHLGDMVRSGVLPDLGGFDTDLLALLDAPARPAGGRILFMPPGHSAADHAATAWFLGRLGIGAGAPRGFEAPELPPALAAAP